MIESAAKASFDLKTTPVTWDVFRAAAKKMTEQGGGKYYGLIVEGQPGNRFASIAGSFARRAAPIGGDINVRTGEYSYALDSYLTAIDLLLGLKADGSIFPGSVSLNAAQTRTQFAQSAAGVIVSGMYNIPRWKVETLCPESLRRAALPATTGDQRQMNEEHMMPNDARPIGCQARPWLQRMGQEAFIAGLPQVMGEIARIGYAGFETALACLPLDDPERFAREREAADDIALAGAHAGGKWWEPTVADTIPQVAARASPPPRRTRN